MITAKMIANVEQMGGNGSVSKTDLQTLEKLTVEFADELALLGVKVTALEDDMQVVKEDVAGLKKDVDGIKSYMKNGGMEKVRLSGDMLIQNYGYDFEDPNNGFGGDDNQHRTQTMLRLQLDANIDENVTARARWNMVDGTLGALRGANEWDGGNKGTGDVEVAYIQIKDMFSFGGDFKFGRDWYQHGHGFVIHNYMDAVNYTKRCGDVDLALNVFFERNGVKDTYNIWNVNADYSTKGHNLYLGLYYQEFGYDDMGNALADNEKKTVVEFGSEGKLSNNNEKVRYDLGLVYSDLKEADQSGILGHVAVKYDDQKQLKAKLAYTFADDESNANISCENYNSYHMGDETIFDDMYKAAMANGRGTNRNFNNLTDIKLEVGYTLKDNDKHNFRLAYDIIQSTDDDKPVPAVQNALDVDANLITFEYTYKLAENTRLRLGYQNFKEDGNGRQETKFDLYYTELYSRF